MTNIADSTAISYWLFPSVICNSADLSVCFIIHNVVEGDYFPREIIALYDLPVTHEQIRQSSRISLELQTKTALQNLLVLPLVVREPKNWWLKTPGWNTFFFSILKLYNNCTLPLHHFQCCDVNLGRSTRGFIFQQYLRVVTCTPLQSQPEKQEVLLNRIKSVLVKTHLILNCLSIKVFNIIMFYFIFKCFIFN